MDHPYLFHSIIINPLPLSKMKISRCYLCYNVRLERLVSSRSFKTFYFNFQFVPEGVSSKTIPFARSSFLTSSARFQL